MPGLAGARRPEPLDRRDAEIRSVRPWGHRRSANPPPGDHLGTDHRAALRNAASTARDAWLGTDLDRLCHLPFGSYPASIAAGINLFDVLAHCWDIAGPTRNQLAIPNRLWEAGLTAAHAVIGPDRDLDHYSAQIDVAATASPAEKFLAFLGRAEWPLYPKHDGEADPRAELPDDASPA